MLEVGFSGLPKLLSEEHVLKMVENLCYFQFPAVRLRDTCWHVPRFLVITTHRLDTCYPDHMQVQNNNTM